MTETAAQLMQAVFTDPSNARPVEALYDVVWIATMVVLTRIGLAQRRARRTGYGRAMKLRPSVHVDHPTATIAAGGAVHATEAAIASAADPPVLTFCGRVASYTDYGSGGHINCKACLKRLGIPGPQPLSGAEFEALARELGIDMKSWRAAIRAESFDNDGMPWGVYYPGLIRDDNDGVNTYEVLLRALARVV